MEHHSTMVTLLRVPIYIGRIGSTKLELPKCEVWSHFYHIFIVFTDTSKLWIEFKYLIELTINSTYFPPSLTPTNFRLPWTVSTSTSPPPLRAATASKERTTVPCWSTAFPQRNICLILNFQKLIKHYLLNSIQTFKFLKWSFSHGNWNFYDLSFIKLKQQKREELTRNDIFSKRNLLNPT